MKVEQDDVINLVDDEPAMEVELAPPNLIIPAGNTAFDVQFQLSAESLKEEPDAKAQLFRRINKFFEYNKYIEPGKEHFRPRKEPNYHLPEVQLIPNQLVLFGSDFKKFKTLREEFGAIEVQKINDSNCKLTFKGFDEAWNSILNNALEVNTIVSKRQGEDAPIPQCWFDMKPYTHLEKMINVQVRFATTEDLTVQPEKEDLIYTYKDSKDIFNNQQNRLKEEEKFSLELKRQKLDIKKQKNSDILYKKYESQNRKEWNAGKNNNPGANRENSRSRSRDKINEKKASQDNDDVQSNYSYGLDSTSRRDLKEINKQLNNFSLGQQPASQPMELDLSYDYDGKANTNLANVQAVNSSLDYNWKGSQVVSTSTSKWNYKQYTQLKEREEQEKRKKVVPIIIID